MFDHAHKGPGRRLATGCNMHDVWLATFGFVAHAAFFMFIGLFLAAYLHDAHEFLMYVTAIVAAALLVFRIKLVGATTTKESIAAIKKAMHDGIDNEL